MMLARLGKGASVRPIPKVEAIALDFVTAVSAAVRDDRVRIAGFWGEL
jgi:hypothetical protein